jgi:hypothetical protein
MAAVIAFSAGYLASRRQQDDGQPANALPQADGMPTESAGRC